MIRQKMNLVLHDTSSTLNIRKAEGLEGGRRKIKGQPRSRPWLIYDVDCLGHLETERKGQRGCVRARVCWGGGKNAERQN